MTWSVRQCKIYSVFPNIFRLKNRYQRRTLGNEIWGSHAVSLLFQIIWEVTRCWWLSGAPYTANKTAWPQKMKGVHSFETLRTTYPAPCCPIPDDLHLFLHQTVLLLLTLMPIKCCFCAVQVWSHLCTPSARLFWDVQGGYVSLPTSATIGTATRTCRPENHARTLLQRLL